MSLRVAVIGVGHIGSLHLDAYRAQPDVEIVAVCDLLKEKAEAAARQIGARAYHSVGALLQNEEFEAVSICTAGAQNGSHHFSPAMQ